MLGRVGMDLIGPWAFVFFCETKTTFSLRELAIHHVEPGQASYISRMGPTAAIFRDQTAVLRHLDNHNAPGSRTFSLSTGAYSFLEYRLYELNARSLHSMIQSRHH